MTRHAGCLALGAAVLCAACPARLAAQQTPAAGLPPARTVIARYVAAIGGREAIARLPARWERGRQEVVSAGVTLRYELFAAPNRQFTRSEMPGLGEVTSGVDGPVAWLVDPATGPILLEGLALQQARQGADPLAALHPARYVASAETVGDTTFGGARCWKVKITTTWNEEYDEFFSAETGLLQGTTRAQVSAQGSVAVTSQIVAWRTVAGVRLPRVTRTRAMGAEIVSTVDSTEVRTVPDSVFALPPGVRALRGGS